MSDPRATTTPAGAGASTGFRARRARFKARHAQLRARLDDHPRLRLLYKILIAVLGLVVVVVGLILVPLPGPGWLIVFLGVALLGTEFPAAHRVTQWVKRLAHRLRSRWRAWRASRQAGGRSDAGRSAAPR